LKYVLPQHGTASGAVCKHVKRWVKQFSKEDLEFYALHFPKEPWKKLADICHFHPKQVCVMLKVNLKGFRYYWKGSNFNPLCIYSQPCTVDSSYIDDNFQDCQKILIAKSVRNAYI